MNHGPMGGETVAPTAAQAFETQAQRSIFTKGGIAFAAVATERLDLLVEAVGFRVV